MAKYTYDVKHKVERDRERAKPGKVVYFTISRGVFRALFNISARRLSHWR